MDDFFTGIKYFLRGYGLINRRGVRRYFLIPLLINIVVYTALIWIASVQFDALMNWLMADAAAWSAGDSWWAGIVNFFISIFRGLLWLVFAIALIVITFFTFTIVANLLGAPFNGLLSERVERELSGTSAGSAGPVLAGIWATTRSELRKYLYFIFLAILLIIITFIPVVNIISPVLWLLFFAWMQSIEYLAYPMENHGRRFKEVRATIRQRRMLTLGFGAAATVAAIIPLVNFVLMPAAVAGATAMWVEQIRKTG